MKKLLNLNAVIVAVTIGIVLWPFLGGQLDGEPARWHLAAAANAIELQEGDYEEHLERAITSSPKLEDSLDYWIVRTKGALQSNPQQIGSVIAAAVAKDKTFSALGWYATRRLEQAGEFALAAEALDAALDEEGRADSVNLNFLAYMRSLAGIDLDKALEDIETVLLTSPEEPAYRDTRAWVLFQMGRPLEALKDANFAIEASQPQASSPSGTLSALVEYWQRELAGGTQTETSSETDTADSAAADSEAGAAAAEVASDAELEPAVAPEEAPEPQALDEEGKPGSASSKTGEPYLTQQQADPAIWQMGALRYHRARILDALGRTDEANEDWDWLRVHRLPPDDRLR